LFESRRIWERLKRKTEAAPRKGEGGKKRKEKKRGKIFPSTNEVTAWQMVSDTIT